jgi:hypothetical protein
MERVECLKEARAYQVTQERSNAGTSGNHDDGNGGVFGRVEGFLGGLGLDPELLTNLQPVQHSRCQTLPEGAVGASRQQRPSDTDVGQLRVAERAGRDRVATGVGGPEGDEEVVEFDRLDGWVLLGEDRNVVALSGERFEFLVVSGLRKF